MSQVWLITGASRGLGRAIADAALAAGHSVVATTRSGKLDKADPQFTDRLLVLPLDVTTPDEQAYTSVVRPRPWTVSDAGAEASRDVHQLIVADTVPG